MSETQVEQFARILKVLIQFSDVKSLEIERRLGFSTGYISRLLNGKIDVKLTHVLDIAEILEIYPQELFAIAFPPAKQGPSPGLQHIQKVLPHLVPPSLQPPAPAATAPPVAVDLEQLHEKLEAGFNELVQRVLAEMGSAPAP